MKRRRCGPLANQLLLLLAWQGQPGDLVAVQAVELGGQTMPEEVMPVWSPSVGSWLVQTGWRLGRAQAQVSELDLELETEQGVHD